jgi:rod shape-determining protein MreB and related proteins
LGGLFQSWRNKRHKIHIEDIEMLKYIIGKFSSTLYIEIWEDRIKVTDMKTGTTFDEKPLVAIKTNNKGFKSISAIGNNTIYAESEINIKVVNPFSHPRTLLSDFEIGERLLRYIFQKLSRNTIFKAAPAVVIHPMEKTEGGLTMIEKRAFKELAFSAGAREAVIYQGHQLSRHDFDFEAIKNVDDG